MLNFNPHIDKDAVTDKRSVLDVCAKTEAGKQVNLEIQVSNKYDMAKRSLYYSAKMYEEQLEEGKLYNLAKSHFDQQFDLQLPSGRSVS